MSNFYPATDLIGGGEGALDALPPDGADLADGDVAIVVTDGTTYTYRLDDHSGPEEEDPPYVIAPDSSPGDKRWILQSMAGVNGETGDHFATREYVDLAQNAYKSFFISDIASGVGSLDLAYPHETSNAQSTIVTSAMGIGDAQLVRGFITEAGEPNTTTIKAGIITFHFHAKKGASNHRTTILYAELYYVDADGTTNKTLLATTEDSIELTDTEANFEIHIALANDVDIASTARLILDVKADVGSGAVDSVVTMYMEGTEDSYFSAAVVSGIWQIHNDRLDALSGDAATPTLAGIIMADGGTIGQADGPLLTFNDTDNFLGITGCKVGFGTLIPTRTVEIVGTGPRLQLRGTGVTGYSLIHFENNTGVNWAIGVGGSEETYYGTPNDLVILDGAADEIRMLIESGTGNVHIGGVLPKTILTLEGTLTLKEQASADADTAAYGQIWTKSGTPNTLWFTNDAGGDYQIGGIMGSIVMADGGTIGQSAGPLLTFDDGTNKLGITGCSVDIGAPYFDESPLYELQLAKDVYDTASTTRLLISGGRRDSGQPCGYFIQSSQLASGIIGSTFAIVVAIGNYNPDEAVLGTTRFFIDKDGKVGINTVDPQESLHVYGSNTQRFEIEASGASSAVIKMTNSVCSYGFFAKGSANELVIYDYVAGAERLVIIGDGGIKMFSLKSGANQGAAGAAVNELWRDTADNSIKLGV